jgi:hypothetical protein
VRLAAVEGCLATAKRKAQTFVRQDRFRDAHGVIESMANEIRAQAQRAGLEQQLDQVLDGYRFAAQLARAAQPDANR